MSDRTDNQWVAYRQLTKKQRIFVDSLLENGDEELAAKAAGAKQVNAFIVSALKNEHVMKVLEGFYGAKQEVRKSQLSKLADRRFREAYTGLDKNDQALSYSEQIKAGEQFAKLTGGYIDRSEVSIEKMPDFIITKTYKQEQPKPEVAED